VLGVMAQRVADGAVDLREAKELVALAKLLRRDDGVEPGRRVLDEGPILGAAAEEAGDACRRLAQQPRQVAPEEGVSIRRRQAFAASSTMRGVAP
jgi:hypothetical protein